MNFALHLPINAVSFGQDSVGLLREIHSRGLLPSLFLIGQPDLSAYNVTEDFQKWLNECIKKGLLDHSRYNPIFKLWHLNGSMESFSNNQILLTFHETDQLTPFETNVIKNNYKVLVTSEFSKNVFQANGAKNVDKIPLFFDSLNFFRQEKKYFEDDRITFNLVGKFEHRKRTTNTIRAWVKKYGDNPAYELRCAIYNSFLSPEDNQKIVNMITEGKSYFNLKFLSFMPKNNMYNEYLNSGNIIIGASGGEGFGLGEMHSLALGKHGIMLAAHSYTEFANNNNAVMFDPCGKIPAYDGMFFHPNQPFNQGNFFDWDNDSFINACEEAIRRVRMDRVNHEGMKLQSKFTVKNTVDQILSYF